MIKLTKPIVTVLGWVYPEMRGWSSEQVMAECQRSAKMVADIRRIRQALKGDGKKVLKAVSPTDDFEACESMALLVEELTDPHRLEVFELSRVSDHELVELLALAMEPTQKGDAEPFLGPSNMDSLGAAMRGALNASPSEVPIPARLQPSGLEPSGLEPSVFNRRVNGVQRIPGKKTAKVWGRGIVGLALSLLILAALVGSFWIFQQPANDHAQQVQPAPQDGERDSDVDSIPKPDDVREPQLPDLTPQLVEDSESKVEKNPSEVTPPKPQVVQQNPGPGGPPSRDLKTSWETVQGLVAYRRETSADWQALGQSPSEMSPYSMQQFEILTLGAGWAQAFFKDSESQRPFEMVVGNSAMIVGNLDWSEAWHIDLSLQRGGIAFRSLPANTAITVSYNDSKGTWRVTKDATNVQFEVADGQLSVASDLGDIEFEGEVVAAPASWVLADGAWIQRSNPRIPTWSIRPKTPTAEEQRVLAQLQPEEDLVDGLLANRNWVRAEDQKLAIQWAIDLDAKKTIPQAFRSSEPMQHYMALSWLLNPSHPLEQVTVVIREMDDVWASTRRLVPRWIAAKRGDSPMTRALVLDMVEGLRPSEPLFVRVTAKAMLETVFPQALASYDPERPDPATVRRISTMVKQRVDQLRLNPR